ncbi:uncharacterized protein BKA78DRAFT_24349 [Phyllosticta capitalensis]|uniref:uncharacterized protein n=1 Tax=Phyllosticta capitalensis TaxID=121624 RepID=UPI00312DBC33
MQSKTRRCHARSVTVQKAASHPGIQALCIRKRSAALAVDSVAMFEVGKWSATSLLFLCLVARTVHMAPPPARPSSKTGNQSSCFDSLRRLKLLECCFCRMVSLFDVLPASAVMPKMGNQQSPSTRSRRLKLSSSGHCSYSRLVSVVSPFLSFLLPFNALSSPFYPHFFIIHRHTTTITINTCVPSSPTPKDHTHTPARPTNSKMPYPPKAYSARRPSVDRSRASRGRLRKRFRPMAPPQTTLIRLRLRSLPAPARCGAPAGPSPWSGSAPAVRSPRSRTSFYSPSVSRKIRRCELLMRVCLEKVCVCCVCGCWSLAGRHDAAKGTQEPVCLSVSLLACLLAFRACALSCPVPRAALSLASPASCLLFACLAVGG